MVVSTQLTIGGSTIIPDSCKVKKSLGDINSSSTIDIKFNNYNGNYSTDFTIGDEIKTYVSGINIFTGILTDIAFKGKELKEDLSLVGKDYSYNLIDRTVEPEVYTNMTTGSIVRDIINKYTQGITTTNVVEGGSISRITFNQTPVFDAIKQLSDMNAFTFYIDENKDLHFGDLGSVSSGYTFGSGNILTTNFKESRDGIFNEVWVYGDRYLDGFKQTITTPAGGGSVFTLLYKPHNVAITVSGAIIQPGGIYNMSPGSNVKFLVNFDDKQIIFTSGTTFGANIPSQGNDVIFDYMRNLPIIKMGQNNDSINKYGKRVKIIVDKNIKDAATAELVKLSWLEQYSDPLKQGTISLNNVYGLIPGQMCNVNIPIYGINNQEYQMTEINYDLTQENLYRGNIISLKLNKSLPDITDNLQDILSQLKKIQSTDISNADLLTRYMIITGSLSLRQSGCGVWTRSIGSSFILGHPINGLLGSYSNHYLGDYRTGSILQWSGGYW